MNRIRRLIPAALVAVAVGCGGSAPQPETPASDPMEPEPLPEEAPPAKVSSDMEEMEADGTETELVHSTDEEVEKEYPEPEFTDDMTVNQAISAVPQGAPRVDVPPDELGKLLTDPKLYAPCKLTPAQHFKLRVAVWDGKAVGVTVKADPKNQKLEQCIDSQVRALEWDAKVKSLNTVDYAM